MKIKYSRINIRGAFLAISLLLGVGITSASTAQAQWRNDSRSQDQRDYNRDDQRRRDRDDRSDRNRRRNNDGYSNLGGSFQLRQTALNAGFNNGVEAGRKDRKRGERFEYRDEGAFQNASKDYSSKLGDRETYRTYFREAFSHGYADGYSGH